MSINTLPKIKSNQQGMVILEALIAVLIFSLGILALVGLQAAMIKNTGASKYRMDASYIAQKTIGEMWANPANLTSFEETDADISSLLAGGLRTVTKISDTEYQVTIGWTAPGEAIDDTTKATCGMDVAHCYTTIANITGI